MGKLVDYDFKIIYRSGRQNQAADTLSRPPDIVFNSITVCTCDWVDELCEDNKTHSELLKIQQDIQDDPEAYTFREGLLFFSRCLVIPSNSFIRNQLLEEFHSSPLGGHAGVARTFHRVSSNFYWKNMHQDVKNFVKICQICQQMKDTHHAPADLLQPLPIPEMVFEEIAMDFITCLPSSKGITTIMTVIASIVQVWTFHSLTSLFFCSICCGGLNC